MAKYAITINEVLSRTVIVNADNVDNAYNIAMEAYVQGRIELNSEDYLDTWWEHELIDECDKDIYSLLEEIN